MPQHLSLSPYKFFLAVLFGILFFIPTQIALAQGDAGFTTGFDEVDKIGQQSEVDNFEGDAESFVLDILGVILSVVVVVAVIAIVWGGLTYIMAAGDDTKIRRAKTIILFAIIGLLIIGAAVIIVNLVIAIYQR